MTRLHARAAEAVGMPDTNVYVVVFASELDGDGERIEVQRQLDPFDEQERRLGQDTYCISTHTGATTYAGLEACRLRGSTLLLTLSRLAAEELGLDQDVEITLDLTDEALSQIWEGLLQVFEHDRNRPSVLFRVACAG